MATLSFRARQLPGGFGWNCIMEGQGRLFSISTLLNVGDSSTDAETAKAAGVPFMAVLSGTTPREELQDSGAVGILDDLGQLPGVLGD